MDAVKFFEEYARMLKTIRKGITITNMYIVTECVMPGQESVSTEISATKDEIEKIIDWSKNHPKKTRLQDFLEKYPKATFGTIDTEDSSYPDACCAFLGYCDCVSNGNKEDCKKCWNEPVD